MKLKSRQKLIIWLVVGMLGPGLTLFVSTHLNITKKDPKLGDNAYSARFLLDGRYADASKEITIDTAETKGKNRTLKVAGMGKKLELPIARDGSLGKDVYSLFWVRLANPIAQAGTESKVWEAKARDDLGLLGEPGKIYTVKSIEPFIYWDYILCSQASYSAAVYDGKQRVATAIYDMTSGMLFDLQPNVGGWGRAYLVKTDFPISRNRYVMLYFVIVFGIIIIAWFALQLAKSSPERRCRAVENLWLAVAIALTVNIDFVYDTWFYAVGDWFTIALHVGAILILFPRFRLWTIPIILELAWVLAYSMPTSGKLAPGIVWFPSMLVATAMMIMFRKAPKPRAK
jgi:hypothetical protein